MNSRFEDLESLMFDWESGSLDEQGIERLREILKSDPKARSHFVSLQLLSAAMQQDADTGLTAPIEDSGAHLVTPSPPHPITPSLPHRITPSPRRSRFWLVGAASLFVFAVAGWIVHSFVNDHPEQQTQVAETDRDEPRDASQEPTAHGVALVTRLVAVTWADDQAGVEVGEALPPGRFAIQSGHAQIEFFCGATVVVEGPAELELKSATLARVRRGRLRAHVPPAARGFSLELDDMKVVDLGTEFGLAVSPDGASVQVFDGEVELQPATNKKRRLKSGEAVVRTRAGEYRDSSAVPESFVDIADLQSRAADQSSARFQRWKDWSTELRRDSRLIAYYAFEEEGKWQRRLACSKEPVDSELDGAIVGARQVEGRWAAKRALEFKQPADRVRVQIPGKFGSLTLACWVKIDSLDRWYNSLFLTDGYDKGETHWQILDDGRIYFSVRPVERGESGPRDYKALSPSFWEPSLQGKWIHLAVTCDLDSSTIIHYLNGEELSRHNVPKAQMPSTTRIGTASIGNWALPTMPDAKFAIRNLNGSIDELAIFAAALTAEEVRAFYDVGKP